MSSSGKTIVFNTSITILCCILSLPISILVYLVIYLFTGLNEKIFLQIYGNLIGLFSLTALLTNKVVKEKEAYLAHHHYIIKYMIIVAIVFLVTLFIFFFEAFYIFRYFKGQMNIITQHRYYFVLSIMLDIFFFDGKLIGSDQVVTTMFYYLLSWALYFIINDSIPLGFLRTCIYVLFMRHHILKFLPKERFTTKFRLFLFAFLIALHILIFSELSMLTEHEHAEQINRAIYYQSHLHFGFTIINARLIKPMQKRVLDKPNLLFAYIIVCYCLAIIMGSITFVLYHFVFFPYFFDQLFSTQVERIDSLYVSASLNWIMRVVIVMNMKKLSDEEIPLRPKFHLHKEKIQQEI